MAITVGSMVLAIIVSALGASLIAWDRVRNEKRKTFSSVFHILDLMNRQVCYLDFKADFPGFSGSPLLIAESKKLVFASRISPMGVSKNNSVLAAYLFDEENRVFSYRQKILSAFNSEDDLDRFVEGDDAEGSVETEIPVAKLEFAYRGEDSQFREKWDEENGLPEEIRISLWMEEKGQPFVWIIKTAPFGPVLNRGGVKSE
ncbi:hypothetical protein SAMN05660836_01127 [Thermodesulforhabdus norvegica]|uniref:General secretion pathway protein J n=1 Tax=Thermodesulforhabdus norvegica TaxID=39841 RepID=A0A1I4SRJ5_9BACT|nr:hypothetical protein SAMN05660836_01127 [Thermodesulforhabdus norvegica]